MKSKRLINALGDVDERYVEEANPQRRPIIRRRQTVAACILGAILILNLWLFLPIQTNMSAVNKYSDSEYFPLIQKMYAFTSKPRYRNYFSALLDGILSIRSMNKGDAMEMSPTGTGANGEYTEVTDNQVSGIIEWDVIKRTDRYIFHLQNDGLRVYEINGLDTAVVASVPIDSFFDEFEKGSYAGDPVMFLSTDCNTVTLIIPVWRKSVGYSDQTSVISLNASDVSNITVKNKVAFSGQFTDARLVGGNILLFTRNYYSPTVESYKNEESFVPQIDRGNGFESMPFEKLVISDNAMAKSCMAIYEINEETLEINDMIGIYASIIDGIYVSHDGIVLSASYTKNTKDIGIERVNESISEIFAISFKNGFEYRGSTSIEGYVKDQYSFDIKDNILRVVTTTRTLTYVMGEEKFDSNETISRLRDTSASLYCISLENMETVASVEKFAPKGEVVRSVRFDKDKAYVCTSYQQVMLDPVFIFDISNTGSITAKDTGVIPGFSDSLINFGDYLLGIGYGETGETKLEAYREGESTVESICTYEPEFTTPCLEYKSFLIDRENGLFGFSYTEYGNGRREYFVLLGFDGSHFTELAKIEIVSSHKVRALIIDDCLYVFQHSNELIIKNLR